VDLHEISGIRRLWNREELVKLGRLELGLAHLLLAGDERVVAEIYILLSVLYKHVQCCCTINGIIITGFLEMYSRYYY